MAAGNAIATSTCYCVVCIENKDAEIDAVRDAERKRVHMVSTMYMKPTWILWRTILGKRVLHIMTCTYIVRWRQSLLSTQLKASYCSEVLIVQ